MPQKKDKNVQVICRFRPPLGKEVNAKLTVRFPREHPNNVVVASGTKELMFGFDKVYPPATTQTQIYKWCGSRLLNDVFEGFNATILTYGQTGTGKTFTMEGPDFSMMFHSDAANKAELNKRMQKATELAGGNSKASNSEPGSEIGELDGIVPRLVHELYSKKEEQEEMGWTVTIEATFIEVYTGKLYDLLDKRAETPKIGDPKGGDDSVGVKNHKRVPCPDRMSLIRQYSLGVKNRKVAQTNANPVSSRGHGVFDIHVVQEKGEQERISSLFRLCDLAGSEMSESTGEKKERRHEAKFINTSLTMLGAVVMGLARGDKFVMFRLDLLTRVLEESLGGNAKTLLIVTGSPVANAVKATLNSLRFASTATTVRGKVSKNTGASKEQLQKAIEKKEQLLLKREEELRALQEEAEAADQLKKIIASLKTKLAASDKTAEEKVEKVRKELEAKQAESAKSHEGALLAMRQEMQAARDNLASEKEERMRMGQEKIDALKAQADAETNAKEKNKLMARMRAEMAALNADKSRLEQEHATLVSNQARELHEKTKDSVENEAAKQEMATRMASAKNPMQRAILQRQMSSVGGMMRASLSRGSGSRGSGSNNAKPGAKKGGLPGLEELDDEEKEQEEDATFITSEQEEELEEKIKRLASEQEQLLKQMMAMKVKSKEELEKERKEKKNRLSAANNTGSGDSNARSPQPPSSLRPNNSGGGGSRTSRNLSQPMEMGLASLSQPTSHASFTYLEMVASVPLSPDKLKLRGSREASLVAYVEVLRGGSSTNVFTPVGISFECKHARDFVQLTAGTNSVKDQVRAADASGKDGKSSPKKTSGPYFAEIKKAGKLKKGNLTVQFNSVMQNKMLCSGDVNRPLRFRVGLFYADVPKPMEASDLLSTWLDLTAEPPPQVEYVSASASKAKPAPLVLVFETKTTLANILAGRFPVVKGAGASGSQTARQATKNRSSLPGVSSSPREQKETKMPRGNTVVASAKAGSSGSKTARGKEPPTPSFSLEKSSLSVTHCDSYVDSTSVYSQFGGPNIVNNGSGFSRLETKCLLCFNILGSRLRSLQGDRRSGSFWIEVSRLSRTGDRFEPCAVMRSVSDQGKQTLFGSLMTMSGDSSGGGVNASAYIPLQALCFGDPERPVQFRVLHRGAVLGIIQVPVATLLTERSSFYLEVADVDTSALHKGGEDGDGGGKRSTNGKVVFASVKCYSAGRDLSKLQGSDLPQFQALLVAQQAMSKGNSKHSRKRSKKGQDRLNAKQQKEMFEQIKQMLADQSEQALNEKEKRKAQRKRQKEEKRKAKAAKANEDQYEYTVGNMLQKVMATERMSQINQAVDNIMSRGKGNDKESALMASFKKHRRASATGASRYS